MSLYSDIKDKKEQIGDILKGLQRDADSIDDDVNEVVDMINRHRCETVEEYESLLSKIESKLQSVRGRLYSC